MRLIENLTALCHTDEGVRFNFTTTGPQSALCNIWWTFPEWLLEYKKFGVVPGVSIDAKEISNVYGICVWDTNCFHKLTNKHRAQPDICDGICRGEQETALQRLLSQFKAVVGTYPKLVAMDFSYAIINAARSVFPQLYLVLDDWHLKERQLVNVRAYLDKIKRTGDFDSLNAELHALRNSSTDAKLMLRREELLQRWFGKSSTPDWFRSLYEVDYKLVARCYNRLHCGLRFMFQGMGYSESSNAEYRRIINSKRMQLSEIPVEMRRAVSLCYEEQPIADAKMNSQSVNRMHASGLFRNANDALTFAKAHVDYVLKISIVT